MKKKISLILGLGLLISLSTAFLIVNGNEETEEPMTPSESLEAFHYAAERNDIEGSKQFVADAILQGFENGAFPHYGTYISFIQDYSQKTKDFQIIEGTEKVNGNNATVEVEVTYFNDRKERGDYQMILEDNQWKLAD